MSERVGSGVAPIFDEDGDKRLLGFRDPSGRNWRVQSYAENEPGPSTSPSPSVSAVAYSAGRVSGYTSGGVTWTVNYNAAGNISTVVGGGQTLTMTYNPDGTVASALWS